MTPHPVHYKYPYIWSAGVIDRFIDSYSRVVHFAAKKLWIDDRDFRSKLITTLMLAPKQWRLIRETLKRIQNNNLFDELAQFSRKEFLYYLTSDKVFQIVYDEMGGEPGGGLLDGLLD